MSVSKKPMVLVILDGYGYREDQQDNAIYSAKTPVMDALWAKRPHTLIDASGLEVGLPDRQMGNSEVGHVNLGAGRIVYQDLTRLDVEIKERTFYANPVLTAAVDKAVAAGKAVHIMGLMSPGGVHSHEDHIMAMVELAAERGAEKIYLHAFLDGRDTPPRSAEKTLATFEAKFAALGKGRIASLIGRYYAMDRDNRWDRVEQAYDLLTLAKGEFQADTAVAGLQAAYARDENDEFVKATVIRAAGQVDAARGERRQMIVLHHDRIGQSVTMVVAATANHGILLEQAQARSGFARIDDAGAFVTVRTGDRSVIVVTVDGVHRVHESGGHGGDAAHALGEVEGDAFGGKQVTYRTGYGGEHLAGLESFAVLDGSGDSDGWVLRGERSAKHLDAAHHAVFARGEVGRAGFVRGDGGLAGDVAVGRVFGERRFDGDADDV